MAKFREITPYEINDNTFKLLNRDWALVAAKNGDGCNMMTISWGGMGIMWNKPVAFTFIRPQRFTFGLIENEEFFSIGFFDEEYREALKFCGTQSGRDFDKAYECSLTPLYDEKAPCFGEARMTLICRKMYAQDMNRDSVIDSKTVLPNYSGDDYHRMYISEIVKVLVK